MFGFVVWMKLSPQTALVRNDNRTASSSFFVGLPGIDGRKFAMIGSRGLDLRGFMDVGHPEITGNQFALTADVRFGRRSLSPQ